MHEVEYTKGAYRDNGEGKTNDGDNQYGTVALFGWWRGSWTHPIHLPHLVWLRRWITGATKISRLEGLHGLSILSCTWISSLYGRTWKALLRVARRIVLAAIGQHRHSLGRILVEVALLLWPGGSNCRLIRIGRVYPCRLRGRLRASSICSCCR